MTDYSNFTPAQREVIFADKGNVLVSASAGSGKTCVMIERLVRLILDGKTDADRILAVTYTNASADDMKKKLVSKIIKEINSGGKDAERLKATLEKISVADVSTFDGFCSSLLRSHFYAIGLDPSFSVADEQTSGELKRKAADSLFERLYEEKDEDFLRLVRIIRSDRTDGLLKEKVVELHVKATTEADPAGFLSACASSVTEETYENYKNGLLSLYKAQLSEYAAELEEVVRAAEAGASEKFVLLSKDLFAKFVSVLNSESLTDAIRAAGAACLDFRSLGRKPDEYELSLRADLKSLNSQLNGLYARISGSLYGDDDQTAKRKFLSTARDVAALSRLTIAFDEEFSALKRRENVVDFSDLERLTYKLLVENPDVKEIVKNKYDFIFADEYQDVNGLQEAILSEISSDNIFMVGDVKQSIYAFRGCNPDIFAAKYGDFKENGGGRALSLDANFRSTKAVLDAVNSVFKEVITEKTGGTDYKANPMIYGELFEGDEGEATLHVIKKSKTEKREEEGVYDLLKDEEKTEEETDMIAEGKLIAELIAEELSRDIYDVKLKKRRPVKPSDIAILSRSHTGKLGDIISTVIRKGIPVSSVSEDPIKDFPEIQLLVNVLKLIEYYADDVPLASVLKSPIGGLSDGDLAEIRRLTPRAGRKADNSFLRAVRVYAEKGENAEIRKKLKAFDEYFSKIRLLSEFSSAGEILSRVISDSGLDLFVAGRPRGAVRLKRIERFIAESEKGGKKLGAVEFLSKLDNVLDNISVSGAETEESVKVMNMHSSKGLEFPIVILSNLDKKFNAKDETGAVLFERSLGIALKGYDETTMVSFDTVARTYFKEKMRVSRITEEARLFYVAMTRAENRLHLITNAEVKEKRFVLSANCPSAFLTLGDMPVKTYEETDLGGDEELLSVRQVRVGKSRKALTDRILKGLNFSYPFGEEALLPLKSAVTRLAEDESKRVFLTDPEREERAAERSYAEKGTAFHRFMELADFSRSDATRQAEEMLKRGKLAESQYALLDFSALNRVLSLSVFKELENFDVYREQPFIAEFSAEELYGKGSGNMLVQGIIDLIAISKDEKSGIIIDYKTSLKSDSALAEIYSAQIGLYKAAAEKSLGIKITGTYIINLLSGRIITVF